MAVKPDYFIGVDVSKNELSVSIIFGDTINNFHISNTKEQILKFFAMYANLESFAVFENTNTYNYDLMRAFDELGLPYSRLDAFKFSHFIKNQKRIKTDKSDAYLLALYAKKFYDELTRGEFSEEYATLKSYQSGIALLNKMLTQASNFKESSESVGNANLLNAFGEIETALKEQIEQAQSDVFALVCELVPQTKQILAENKGINKSFAIYVIPVLYMNKDKKASQIFSYLGLVPRAHQSGSSINKVAHISGGVSLARKTLYMCVLTICRYNKDFAPLYAKHINNGKPKKVALIAVARVFLKKIKQRYFSDE